MIVQSKANTFSGPQHNCIQATIQMVDRIMNLSEGTFDSYNESQIDTQFRAGFSQLLSLFSKNRTQQLYSTFLARICENMQRFDGNQHTVPSRNRTVDHLYAFVCRKYGQNNKDINGHYDSDYQIMGRLLSSVGKMTSGSVIIIPGQTLGVHISKKSPWIKSSSSKLDCACTSGLHGFYMKSIRVDENGKEIVTENGHVVAYANVDGEAVYYDSNYSVPRTRAQLYENYPPISDDHHDKSDISLFLVKPDTTRTGGSTMIANRVGTHIRPTIAHTIVPRSRERRFSHKQSHANNNLSIYPDEYTSMNDELSLQMYDGDMAEPDFTDTDFDILTLLAVLVVATDVSTEFEPETGVVSYSGSSDDSILTSDGGKSISTIPQISMFVVTIVVSLLGGL
jgi:hypothetical protein